MAWPLQFTGANLSTDDTNGLKKLYGSLTTEDLADLQVATTLETESLAACDPSPCRYPEEDETRFQYSNQESQFIDNQRADLAQEFGSLEDAILPVSREFSHLRETTKRNTGTSAERLLLKRLRNRQGSISSHHTITLEGARKAISWQIESRRFMKDSLAEQLSTSDLRFLESEIRVMIQIRRDIIRELQGR